MLLAARTRTEFALRALQLHTPGTRSLTLNFDIRSCHTVHTFKNTSKYTCSEFQTVLTWSHQHLCIPLKDYKALRNTIIIKLHYYYYYYYRTQLICRTMLLDMRAWHWQGHRLYCNSCRHGVEQIGRFQQFISATVENVPRARWLWFCRFAAVE